MIIREIRSNKKSFKPVRFNNGANIVLAERSKESAKKYTRNGLGKSTLLAILDYCLGGRKGGTLASPQLEGWTFSLDAEHGGRPFSVSRSTDGRGTVEVEGDVGPWLAADAATPTLSGAIQVGLEDYKHMLGRIMFGLDPGVAQKHHLTFRSLASYCIRQGGKSGGYRSPFCNNQMQAKFDAQVNNAYLLGLNWKLVGDLAHVHDVKMRLKQLEKEATEGVLKEAIGGVGDLEAIRVRLEYKSQKEEEMIRDFRVHKEYAQLEREANDITEHMHGLVNKRSVQAKTLERYRESTKLESDVSPDSVLETYKKSGILFPESIKQSLEEAIRFHEFIVENRREFLGSEIAKLDEEVAAIGQQIDDAGKERGKIMRILETHGAVEELVAMQARHEKTVEEKADVLSRLGTLREIGRRGVANNAEMVRLSKQAESDFDACKAQRRDAILAFNRYSEALYSAPGMLSIGMKEGEYRFDVEIERSGSKGIGNMKIFCYDLALASLWAGRPQSPGLLAHDSEIFDGVDERQVALALQTAAKESERLGFQYICAINSDTVPRGDFGGGFEFASHVAVTLTDRGDDGGLLGIRF